MNRKFRQNVATDDRRTFTDKDKVHRIQTLGNDKRKWLSSGGEDKRKLNCHKLRSSYATSILITKLTFVMFLLKLSTLSAASFLFVLSFLCGRSTGVFHQLLLFFQYSLSDVDIRH